MGTELSKFKNESGKIIVRYSKFDWLRSFNHRFEKGQNPFSKVSIVPFMIEVGLGIIFSNHYWICSKWIVFENR